MLFNTDEKYLFENSVSFDLDMKIGEKDATSIFNDSLFECMGAPAIEDLEIENSLFIAESTVLVDLLLEDGNNESKLTKYWEKFKEFCKRIKDAIISGFDRVVAYFKSLFKKIKSKREDKKVNETKKPSLLPESDSKKYHNMSDDEIKKDNVNDFTPRLYTNEKTKDEQKEITVNDIHSMVLEYDVDRIIKIGLTVFQDIKEKYDGIKSLKSVKDLSNIISKINDDDKIDWNEKIDSYTGKKSSVSLDKLSKKAYENLDDIDAINRGLENYLKNSKNNINNILTVTSNYLEKFLKDNNTQIIASMVNGIVSSMNKDINGYLVFINKLVVIWVADATKVSTAMQK